MNRIRDHRQFLPWRAGLLIGLVLGLISGMPASAQENPAQRSGDRVVAQVDDTPIYLSEVRAMHQAMNEQVRAMPLEQIYPQLLERVIALKLMARAARQRNLDETEEHQRRLRIVEDRLLQDAYVQDIIRNQVTDEAVREAYEAFKNDFQGNTEIRASHILVESRERATQIIQQLQDGGDFEELAREHSIDPSKSDGGDLGYFQRDQMVESFANAAFALEVGETTSEPVQTPFGWHVIKVTDKRQGTAPGFDEVRNRLRGQLAQERAEEQLQRLGAVARIQRFNLDGTEMPDRQQSGTQTQE